MNEMIHKQRLQAEEMMRRSLAERIYRRNLIASIQTGNLAGRRLSFLLCIVLGIVFFLFGALACTIEAADPSWLQFLKDSLLYQEIVGFVQYNDHYDYPLLPFFITFIFMGLVMLLTAKAQSGYIKTVQVIGKKKKELQSSVRTLYNRLQQLDQMEADYPVALRGNKALTLSGTGDMLSIASLPQWNANDYNVKKNTLGGFAKFVLLVAMIWLSIVAVNFFFAPVLQFVEELLPMQYLSYGREELQNNIGYAIYVIICILSIWMVQCTDGNMPEGMLRIIVLTITPFFSLALCALVGILYIYYTPTNSNGVFMACCIAVLLLYAVVAGILAHRKRKKRKAEEEDAQRLLLQIMELNKENAEVQKDQAHRKHVTADWIECQTEKLRLMNEVKTLKKQIKKYSDLSGSQDQPQESKEPWLSSAMEEANRLSFQLRKRFPNENAATFTSFQPKGRYPDFTEEQLFQVWNAYYNTLLIQMNTHREELETGGLQSVQQRVKEMKSAADRAVQNVTAEIKNGVQEAATADEAK